MYSKTVFSCKSVTTQRGRWVGGRGGERLTVSGHDDEEYQTVELEEERKLIMVSLGNSKDKANSLVFNLFCSLCKKY